MSEISARYPGGRSLDFRKLIMFDIIATNASSPHPRPVYWHRTLPVRHYIGIEQETSPGLFARYYGRSTPAEREKRLPERSAQTPRPQRPEPRCLSRRRPRRSGKLFTAPDSLPPQRHGERRQAGNSHTAGNRRRFADGRRPRHILLPCMTPTPYSTHGKRFTQSLWHSPTRSEPPETPHYAQCRRNSGGALRGILAPRQRLPPRNGTDIIELYPRICG